MPHCNISCKKSDSKPHFIRWVFLPQEFDLEIRDKAGHKNIVADHFSRFGPEAIPIEELPIDGSFLDDQLFAISHKVVPWYVDLVNFKVCGVIPAELSYQQRKRFLSNAKYYV